MGTRIFSTFKGFKERPDDCVAKGFAVAGAKLMLLKSPCDDF